MGTIIRLKKSFIKGLKIDFKTKIENQGFIVIDQNETGDRLKIELQETLTSGQKTTITNYITGLVHNDIEFDDTDSIDVDMPTKPE